MSNILRFPTREKTTHENLCSSMRKHWRDGKRDSELQDAVAAENQGVSLTEYNAAADAIWAEVKKDGGAIEPTVTTDEYFGGCPHCGKSDGYQNIGPDHWGSCQTHKTKWRIGSNLFSCWHEETEEDWLKNAYRLSQFMEVEPVRGAAV